MTESRSIQRCRWCARPLPDRVGAGRPREFCRQGCRQQAYLARRLAESHGLGPDDVVVSRTALEELQGQLYCLQAAVEDVERDVAGSSSPEDVAEAFRWLLANAKPLQEAWLEPRMGELA